MTKTELLTIESFMVHPGARLTINEWWPILRHIRTCHPDAKISLSGIVYVESEYTLEDIAKAIHEKEKAVKIISISIQDRITNSQKRIHDLNAEIRSLKDIAENMLKADDSKNEGQNPGIHDELHGPLSSSSLD